METPKRQQDVYATQARAYDELVTAEDADGHLGAALRRLVRSSGSRPVVLDAGSGTGRVTRLLAQHPGAVLAIDASRHMLEFFHCAFRRPLVRAVADVGALPVKTERVDLALAGWAFGHATVWDGAEWRDLVARYVSELERATRPGGTIVIIETLGTGVEQPGAPSRTLGAYYDWLEATGFVREVVATDYEFGSLERAVQLVETCFGPELAKRVAERGSSRVPEFSGVWQKTKARA